MHGLNTIDRWNTHAAGREAAHAVHDADYKTAQAIIATVTQDEAPTFWQAFAKALVFGPLPWV